MFFPIKLGYLVLVGGIYYLFKVYSIYVQIITQMIFVRKQ